MAHLSEPSITLRWRMGARVREFLLLNTVHLSSLSVLTGPPHLDGMQFKKGMEARLRLRRSNHP
jgi:hypothetical protein